VCLSLDPFTECRREGSNAAVAGRAGAKFERNFFSSFFFLFPFVPLPLLSYYHFICLLMFLLPISILIQLVIRGFMNWEKKKRREKSSNNTRIG
jgi:hypothetical protein